MRHDHGLTITRYDALARLDIAGGSSAAMPGRPEAGNLHSGQGWGTWHDARFFRRGASDQWRGLLCRADITRHHRRVNELAGTGLAARCRRSSLVAECQTL